MNKVYIVSAKRSPIGKFLGSLSELNCSELASQVIVNSLEKLNIDYSDIDEVILGNVISAGQGQCIARQASIYSNIPYKVPAYTINMVCGSGMKSVINAYHQIKLGVSNLVISGGVEVMSNIPYILNKNIRQGNKMGNMEIKDLIMNDGLICSFNNYHMGVTAENLADIYNISREEQDKFAMNSQRKSIEAIDSGRFYDEIVPIKLNRGLSNFLEYDEFPNRITSIEKLSKLKPIFKENGSVTAGNSSGLNDGASILILASEYIVKKYNLVPLCEIVEIGQGGVDPSIMGIGPVEAIKDIIKKVNISMKNIDLIEINEAFSAQVLAVIKELKSIYSLDDEYFKTRLNVNGGAISLGHPLGASGTRIIATLSHEMRKRNSDYGLASLCIGGGMGTAILLKNYLV